MRRKRNKLFNRKEIIWAFFIILAGTVYYYTLWFYMIFGFINHCVIQYPVRINDTCWQEQKPYAKEKAGESASLFIP